MDRLMVYDWPGNVRELQNIVERALILARSASIGPELVPVEASARPHPVARTRGPHELPSPAPIVAFSEAERRVILHALETTGWRISGRHGAAQVLGLKPTTLHAKMKKLGIRRPVVSRTA
jgi:DNA-binding NtrC family response regulator